MSPPRDSAARSVSTRLPVIASDGRWRNVERTEVVETSHQRLEGAGPSIGLPALSGAGRRNRTCSLPLTRRLLVLFGALLYGALLWLLEREAIADRKSVV